MFTLSTTRLGMTYPLPVLFVNETDVEQAFTQVTMVATIAEETLSLPVEGSMRFVAEDETEYDGPFDGTDFLEAQTGTLYITITETLEVGFYRAFLQDALPVPGVCGYGLLGSIQAGASSQCLYNLSTVLQIQSLADDWRTDAVVQAQPYSVPTVTKPY